MKKSQINSLDKYWSEKVKEKAGYKCEFSLRDDMKLESAHIIGRAFRSTRWGAWLEVNGVMVYDLNGMCLSFSYHQQYDQHGPDHDRIFDNIIGEERWERLCKAKLVVAKHQDYDQIKEWIKNA